MTVLPPPLPLPRDGAHGAISPAQPGSFGTGTANPDGLHLAYRRDERDGDVVRGTFVVEPRFEGAAGIAHGGIVATVLDDVMGAVMRVVGRPSVTAQLDVTFRRPVLVGATLTLESWLAGVEGRKHRIVGLVLEGERVVAIGRGLFLTVGVEHYEQLGVPVPADAPARAREPRGASA